MSKPSLSAVCAFLLLANGSTLAARDMRVLIPIADSRAGAYGTVWDVRTWFRHDGPIPIGVGPLGRTDAMVPTRQTVQLPLSSQPGQPGCLLFFEATAFETHIATHIREITRGTNGLVLSAVREDDFSSSPISFIAVPIRRAQSRALLRIYTIDGSVADSVRVHVYREDTNIEIATYDVSVGSSDGTRIPGYGQVDLSTSTDGNIRVVAEPLNSGFKLWGFISMTDNTTQEITAVFRH